MAFVTEAKQFGNVLSSLGSVAGQFTTTVKKGAGAIATVDQFGRIVHREEQKIIGDDRRETGRANQAGTYEVKTASQYREAQQVYGQGNTPDEVSTQPVYRNQPAPVAKPAPAAPAVAAPPPLVVVPAAPPATAVAEQQIRGFGEQLDLVMASKGEGQMLAAAKLAKMIKEGEAKDGGYAFKDPLPLKVAGKDITIPKGVHTPEQLAGIIATQMGADAEVTKVLTQAFGKKIAEAAPAVTPPGTAAPAVTAAPAPETTAPAAGAPAPTVTAAPAAGTPAANDIPSRSAASLTREERQQVQAMLEKNGFNTGQPPGTIVNGTFDVKKLDAKFGPSTNGSIKTVAERSGRSQEEVIAIMLSGDEKQITALVQSDSRTRVAAAPKAPAPAAAELPNALNQTPEFYAAGAPTQDQPDLIRGRSDVSKPGSAVDAPTEQPLQLGATVKKMTAEEARKYDQNARAQTEIADANGVSSERGMSLQEALALQTQQAPVVVAAPTAQTEPVVASAQTAGRPAGFIAYDPNGGSFAEQAAKAGVPTPVVGVLAGMDPNNAPSVRAGVEALTKLAPQSQQPATAPVGLAGLAADIGFAPATVSGNGAGQTAQPNMAKLFEQKLADVYNAPNAATKQAAIADYANLVVTNKGASIELSERVVLAQHAEPLVIGNERIEAGAPKVSAKLAGPVAADEFAQRVAKNLAASPDAKANMQAIAGEIDAAVKAERGKAQAREVAPQSVAQTESRGSASTVPDVRTVAQRAAAAGHGVA